MHELCFINPDSDGKLVTHVTNTLQSQHPVEKGAATYSGLVLTIIIRLMRLL